MKMWSGRFKDTIDAQADSFNSSLSFDKRLYRHDIFGSIAHCTMLGESNIIPKNEADLICKTLNQILADIDSAKLEILSGEDIHMFVEEELTKRIGSVGKKLHTGRSRNDQVTLDLRLYIRDSITNIVNLLKKLCHALIAVSDKNLNTIMPAYTHMQKAQPTTLAHHLMAYTEMFMRDIERLCDCNTRVNVMPLGSGACTTTTYPLNRDRVAELLEFPTITQNSLDAVSDRDYVVEFLSVCSMIMLHMSRINEEFIYWASDEFKFLELDDKFSTGSSIMPQKKNPDMNELIRGKTGRCYGNLFSMLTTLKGLPLSYNKDMQEDKEAVFDTEDTVKAVINIFTAMLPTMRFNTENLFKAASGGFTSATECADYLVKKGMPFRDAHAVIGSLVIFASENHKKLDELTLSEYQNFSPLFQNDILNAVNIVNAVNNRNLVGSPSPKSIANEILTAEKKLNNFHI